MMRIIQTANGNASTGNDAVFPSVEHRKAASGKKDRNGGASDPDSMTQGRAGSHRRTPRIWLRPALPAALAAEIPCNEDISHPVSTSRAAIRDILAGRDRRLPVVIGPCSIHDPEAAA